MLLKDLYNLAKKALFCGFALLLLASCQPRDAENIASSVDPSGATHKQTIEAIHPIYETPLRKALSQLFGNESNVKFTPLTGGMSAASLFLLEGDQQKYVLRLMPERQTPEKKLAEIEANRIAAQLGITPKLRYVDDETSLLIVMDYIDGRSIKIDDLNNHRTMKKVMEALRLYHSTVPNKTIFKYTKLDAINELYHRYKKRGVVFPSVYEKLLLKINQDFKSLKTPFVPSHGDFNPGNILLSKENKIYIIDWPHAGMDNPYLEIGWFACFMGANHSQIKTLLSFYLKRQPTSSEVKETLFFKNMTKFLMATLLMGRQEERDQKVLDDMLESSLVLPSYYIKRGIKLDIKERKGREFTEYTLSWLKEYIQDQHESDGLF